MFRKLYERFRGKMECFFGLIGVAFAATFIIISALVTPNYSPLYHTVSSLGQGIAKTLFSIGFVAAGSLGIPFYIYLEITLKEKTNYILRRKSFLQSFQTEYNTLFYNL